jgi:hypothetical protein
MNTVWVASGACVEEQFSRRGGGQFHSFLSQVSTDVGQFGHRCEKVSGVAAQIFTKKAPSLHGRLQTNQICRSASA